MEIWQSADKNKLAQFFWDTVYTHVSTPDVRIKNLVLFIEIKNLNQCQSEADSDGIRWVPDWTSDYSRLLVVSEQIFDEPLLVRQRLVWRLVQLRFVWNPWSDRAETPPLSAKREFVTCTVQVRKNRDFLRYFKISKNVLKQDCLSIEGILPANVYLIMLV